MAQDPSPNSTNVTGAFSEKVVQPLGKEPAFLLIFAICVIFSGGISTYGIVSQSAQALYVGLAAFALALCAAVGVVWIITRARESGLLVTKFEAGREIAVEPQKLMTSAASAQSADPATHYIDSAHGFLFSRPKSDIWGQPELISGMSNIIPARMQVDSETLQSRLYEWSLLPFGKMLIEQSLMRLKTGHVLNVAFSEDSTTDLAEAVIERLRPDLVKKNPDASSEDIEIELKKTRRNLVRGFVQSMQVSNEFCVTYLDKSLVPMNFKPTLAGIFLQVSTVLASIAVDLMQKEKSITLTTRTYVRNVLVNGQKMDLSAERWMLLTEGRDYFYLVEIGFSPQTQDSFAVWEDLRGMIDSFRLIA